MFRRFVMLIVAAFVLAATAGVMTGIDAAAPKSDAPSAPRVRDHRSPHSRPARPPGRYRRRGRRLTEKQAKELLATLKTERPEFYQRLLELQKKDPQAYRRLLGRTWRWFQKAKNLPEDIRKAAKDREEARRLRYRVMRDIRKAGATKELKDKLRQAIADEFKAEQILREHKLAELEKQIKEIREDLKNRREQHDELVAGRLERLLKEAQAPPRPKRPRRKPTTRPARKRL